MKRIASIFLIIAMLLSSMSALADAPNVDWQTPVDIKVENQGSIVDFKYNGSAYHLAFLWEEDGEYHYDNGDSNVTRDQSWFYNFAEKFYRGEGVVVPWLLYLSGADFEANTTDFYATYYEKDGVPYVRIGQKPYAMDENGVLVETDVKIDNILDKVDVIVDENGVVVGIKAKGSWMKNNIRSFGPAFADVNAELTKKWYRFTPVDLSQDGVQMFDLISGDYYTIGTVAIIVSGDTVKVEYKYNIPVTEVAEYQFYTFFNDIDSVKGVEAADIEKRFEYSQEYSIANDLGGDTNVLFYMLNMGLHTREAAEHAIFRPESSKTAAQIEALVQLMD